MESPYSVELNRLRKTGSLFNLAFLIFGLATIALLFLPGIYFLFGLVPTIISMFVSLKTTIKIEEVEGKDLAWKISREIDVLTAYFTQEEDELHCRD